jgi:uncharacterized protein (DUF2141 family)
MKKNLLLIATMVFGLSAYSQSATAPDSLTVEVSGLKKVEGSMLYVAIINAESKEIGQYQSQVTSSTLSFKIASSGEEKLALRMFQDLDGDNEMNRGMFGIPSEPYGFSNNPEIKFGPPSLKEMLFDTASAETIKVSMQ